MSDIAYPADGATSRARVGPSDLYRAVWRWHFYAGLLVLPFLALLAVTGGIYLFRQQLDPVVHARLMRVEARLPRSAAPRGEHAGHAGPADPASPRAETPAPDAEAPRAVGLDAAVAAFDRLGLAPGYAVALPVGPTGVYTGSVYPNDLFRQRVVHLDQHSGKPLLDMGYADYGPLGRVLEWGINVHMGQQWGLANQLILLAVCAATVLLCVSSAMMWWKRRPRGSLGVPPLPFDRRVLRGVVAILAVGGVIFPLVGLSLLVMLALDLAFVRLARRQFRVRA